MSSSSVENMFAGQGDQFPVGLQVLVVDDSITCQKILTKMLEVCGYKVTKCSSADVAVSLLKENKHEFDLVISDVHMPCMDGLKLLEHIRLETDLPVIMVSGDDSQDVVMKAVTGEAFDYLIKPVRMDILKNIWQHVARKKNEDSSSQKLRVIWTLDLHKKFIDAFNELGADKASAKKILTLMDVPGLTRDNVSSHLQKYRKYLAEQQQKVDYHVMNL